MKIMLSQEVEGALVYLYRTEMRLRRLLEERAPEQVVTQTKEKLRRRWDEARKIGVTEELMSRFGWSLYVEDVSISLERRFRDECDCHSAYQRSNDGIEPRPCAHAETLDSCSPFCPHFRTVVPPSDLSGLAGQE